MTIDHEKIQRRIARLSTDDLMMWADNAASGMQRQMDDFRRTPVEDHLHETKLAAVTMQYVCDELLERQRKAKQSLDDEQHAG